MRQKFSFSDGQVGVSPKSSFGNFHPPACFSLEKACLTPFPLAKLYGIGLALFTHNPQHMNICSPYQSNILRMPYLPPEVTPAL
jgi:hypothetical protein